MKNILLSSVRVAFKRELYDGLFFQKSKNILRAFDTAPSSLMDSTASPNVKITKRRSWGALLGSQHFGGRGAC
jgi:hypothetical protein